MEEFEGNAEDFIFDEGVQLMLDDLDLETAKPEDVEQLEIPNAPVTHKLVEALDTELKEEKE